MADTILFKNETAVSYDPNPTDDEDKDADIESDGSDSRESSAEEDVPPHKTLFIPKFGLVDASDDDKTASHGALPEHSFFGGNEELRKRIVFGSKE